MGGGVCLWCAGDHVGRALPRCQDRPAAARECRPRPPPSMDGFLWHHAQPHPLLARTLIPSLACLLPVCAPSLPPVRAAPAAARLRQVDPVEPRRDQAPQLGRRQVHLRVRRRRRRAVSQGGTHTCWPTSAGHALGPRQAAAGLSASEQSVMRWCIMVGVDQVLRLPVPHRGMVRGPQRRCVTRRQADT